MVRVRTCLRIDSELLRALKIRAVYEGRSVSSIVEEAVRACLNQRPMSVTQPINAVGKDDTNTINTITNSEGPDWLRDNPWVEIIRRGGARA